MTNTTIHITVPDELDTQRLDVFLVRMFDVIPSRAFASKMILHGQVTVDQKQEKPSLRLKAGQIVAVETSSLNFRNVAPVGEAIPLDILFEDEHLIVISKPAGMVVHPGAGVSNGTLVNAILGHCGSTLPSLGTAIRAGIVHRLDRDTSGVMVVAKTQLALTGLAKQFAAHTQKRIYHALVYGVLEPLAGTIETWHGRDPKNRIKYSVQPEKIGKKAIMNYSTTKNMCNNLLSLVACQLHTGRTHQIRVQLSYKKHGVVGDPLYSVMPDVIKNRKELAALIKKHAVRQMLHAFELGFVHPATGEEMHFSAPYPADMAYLLDLLAAH